MHGSSPCTTKSIRYRWITHARYSSFITYGTFGTTSSTHLHDATIASRSASSITGGAPLHRVIDASSFTPTTRYVPTARACRNALQWP